MNSGQVKKEIEELQSLLQGAAQVREIDRLLPDGIVFFRADTSTLRSTHHHFADFTINFTASKA